jgi:hypothetical protein
LIIFFLSFAKKRDEASRRCVIKTFFKPLVPGTGILELAGVMACVINRTGMASPLELAGVMACVINRAGMASPLELAGVDVACLVVAIRALRKTLGLGTGSVEAEADDRAGGVMGSVKKAATEPFGFKTFLTLLAGIVSTRKK